MEFDLGYLRTQLPALWDGLLLTLQVSSVSIFLTIGFGLIGAAMRLLRIPVLEQAVIGYVELIRNTPILAQLFFIFYGLPSIGLSLSAYWSGVLCLTVWGTAYQVENIRGGLASVAAGVRDAAMSLGFRSWAFFWLIAMPLAVRTSLPAILNTSVSVLKNSAYLQAIGFAELTYVAVDRISMDFRMMEMFAAIFVIYLALVLTLSFGVSLLESRLQKPFRA